MLSYELFNKNLLTHNGSGHRPPLHKNVDFADAFVPLSQFFTKVLNIHVSLFGYEFKLLHFLLFALIMAAIKIIWNYATKAI